MQGVAYFKMYRAWNPLIPSWFLEVGPQSPAPRAGFSLRNPSNICSDSIGGSLALTAPSQEGAGI